MAMFMPPLPDTGGDMFEGSLGRPKLQTFLEPGQTRIPVRSYVRPSITTLPHTTTPAHPPTTATLNH